VREDSLSLYGFSTKEERDLFEKLIGVQGIGPRLALALLGHLGPSGLVEGVGSRDVDRFTMVPGIGRKSAERLILELGSALKGVAPFDVSPRSAASSRRADLHSALENLGYRAAQAAAAADAVLSDAATDEPFDSLLRRALKTMSARRSVSEPAVSSAATVASPAAPASPVARRPARRRGA
jgi:Holliday junction DNA helicase RuvA